MYSVKELEQVIRRLYEMRSALDPSELLRSAESSDWIYPPIKEIVNLAAIEAAILQLELVKTDKILDSV